MNPKLHLTYHQSLAPQIVGASFDGKLVGDYIYLAEPVILNNLRAYYTAHFYPTGDIFLVEQAWQAVDLLETLWQTHRAELLLSK